MTSSAHNTSSRSRRRSDALLLWTLRGMATVTGLIVLLIVAFLLLESGPALRELGVERFISDDSWHPLSGAYGMMPMIAGSLAVTIGAVLLATPLGVASALFCRHYAPRRLAGPYRRVIELLAGVPSVVFGFWGLTVWVPWISQSLLAGILILAVMILPTIALLTESSLAALPADLHRSAAALGLTRWGIIRRVLLPAARPGILTAILLAVGRAIGETMAVVMVCGNVVQMPSSLTTPVRTLTANIALEMSYAAGPHRSALFVSGLLLLAIVMMLVFLSQKIGSGDAHA